MTRIEPLTPDERLAYAARLRCFAARMRAEGDLASAALNEWMAQNYSRPAAKGPA